MIYISWMSVTNRYIQIWQNYQFASAPNTLGMRRNSGIVPQTASLNFQNGEPPSKEQLHIIWGATEWSIREISLGVTSLTTMWLIYLIQIFIKEPRVTFCTKWHHSLNSRQEGEKEHHLPWTGMREAEQDKETAAGTLIFINTSTNERKTRLILYGVKHTQELQETKKTCPCPMDTRET